MDPNKEFHEKTRYQQWQDQQLSVWESVCTRCGACCGATEGDPCEHVVALKNGQYACLIYDNRFGTHKTKSGRTFRCVPIRDILHQSWPGDQCCGYKRSQDQS